MRRHVPFLLYLLALSALSGWLMSHMSWIGRVGVNWFHKEYRFLKTWYKGGGTVLVILLLLFFLHQLAQRRLPRNTARAVHAMSLLVAVVGLFLTYSDFRSDFTHNILKERFHLGAYLFWVGWISISIYTLVVARLPEKPSEVQIEGRQQIDE
jgi:hypothetical protein